MSADDSTPLPRRVKDLRGEVFGRLTVVEFAGLQKNGSLWLCRCECGQEKVARALNLRNGDVKSCDCLAREKGAYKYRKYGSIGIRSREYRCWSNMKQRCLDPQSRVYRYYGGRGITVCREWQESFQAFLDHIGPMPSPNHSIDRIDGDGHYEPGNVRWADRAEQARNKRNNHFVEFRGETKCITDWCRQFGIIFATFQYRISRGWSFERALTTPVARKPSAPIK